MPYHPTLQFAVDSRFILAKQHPPQNFWRTDACIAVTSMVIILQLDPLFLGEMTMMTTVLYGKLIRSHVPLVTVELW